MSKYFKNNKSDGDEEYKSVARSRVKRRSYSCKPDIGPSGDHKSLERLPCETRPNFRVNMWLNNVGSGSSQTSQSNNDLYTIDEDHLEKINFIRRKLKMTELSDPPEEQNLAQKESSSREETGRTKPDSLACPLNQECTICRRCREERLNRPSLSSISEKSKISNESTQSIRYKPPPKKICLKPVTPPLQTSSINGQKTDIIEIPTLNLENEQDHLSNENKSIQCTSKDTELTERTSHSTDYWQPKYRHHGDNVDTYVEPEIVVKQPENTGRAGKNCIKFLPIRDEEVTTSGKSNKNEFYDEIVSNCSFSLGQLSAPIPSHDSFFKSKKKQKKRRLKRRGLSTVEGVKLDKSNIEVRRTFPDTSETSEALEEVETDEIPAISKTFDSQLMAGLAMPSKTVKPIKLPLVTKLSELMKGGRSKKGKEVDRDCMFEDDICPAQTSVKQYDTHVRAGAEYSNYREAAEELLTLNERRNENTKGTKVDGTQKTPNKYSTKKRQSVDYQFYSEGLPQSRTCEVLRLSQEVEDASDSECLRAIENCCCIRRIFKKKRSTFFSN